MIFWEIVSNIIDVLGLAWDFINLTKIDKDRSKTYRILQIIVAIIFFIMLATALWFLLAHIFS